MIEIWQQAILPYNLPLTILVGVFALYWIVCILGVVGVDAFDIDLDVDTDTGGDSSFPNPISAMLRFVNAADVPMMVVCSLLAVYLWMLSMLGNYYLNAGQVEWRAIGIFVASFILAVLLVKFTTAPLVPLFKKLEQHEIAEPAVGGTAVVISREVDGKYGQCEQQRVGGAPAILTCKTSEETPIPRGSEVAVVAYDKEKGVYSVRKI
ncbi:MAG: hypothetical protein ACSHX0_08785 [Akkermansiaceae bacterium]